MDTYHVWCDLKPGVRDLTFAERVARYMETLRGEGLIESWRLTRRKLGFGPPGMGEFHIAMEVKDLTQLEAAFQRAAAREGEFEKRHAGVFSTVSGLTTALYRDFPDPVRGYKKTGQSRSTRKNPAARARR